jgi:hypothetical protein
MQDSGWQETATTGKDSRTLGKECPRHAQIETFSMHDRAVGKKLLGVDGSSQAGVYMKQIIGLPVLRVDAPMA